MTKSQEVVDAVEIRMPDDFHLHLRRKNILADVLPFTVSQFRRALIMPNTRPEPILCDKDLIAYRDEIETVKAGYSDSDFEPLMTIQIVPSTTSEIIKAAKKTGAIAGKLYPEGVTTNSENGVTDFRGLWPVFAEIQEQNMILSLHGEDPSPIIEGLRKETSFLHTLRMIADAFPKLRIVLEHITTKDAVECVSQLPGNVAATITLHHLILTLDDVIGYSKDSQGKIRPHNFCKPIAKSINDRAALRKAVMSGNPKFFFGSDSAPHQRGMKERAEGCAGVFSAPVALPLLAQVLEELGVLDKLENFVSVFGAQFYQLPLNTGTVRLTRENWIVPKEYSGIVPFMAGATIRWRIASYG